jgi:hypothetical protein
MSDSSNANQQNALLNLLWLLIILYVLYLIFGPRQLDCQQIWLFPPWNEVNQEKQVAPLNDGDAVQWPKR